MLIQLSKNFTVAEFACPCCGGFFGIDREFITRLQRFRDWVGRPIRINQGGGTRCHALHTAIYAERNESIYWNSLHIIFNPLVIGNIRQPAGLDYPAAADISNVDGTPFTEHELDKMRDLFTDLGVSKDETGKAWWCHVGYQKDAEFKEWSY
tara:strand:- start:6707 stop:7162 length:456 start_codon:yes stop_codon:yes gene_type:complete